MYRMLLLALCMVSLTTATDNPSKVKSSRPVSSLILESANSNENSFSNGEFISVLRGNVIFVYDDIRIRSDEATWWRKKGAVTFNNNIKVLRGRQLLTCRRLNFTKENSLLTATGNFNFYDSTEQSRLCGDDAEYRVTSRNFRIKGSPVLIRYDTASKETLTIKSVSMLYVDSLKRATATDSVRIHKGMLFSTCRLAHYFTKSNTALLRGTPEIWYGIHYISGDSVDLNFSKESLRDASVVGASHGVYADTSGGAKGDTAYTHIWGDSLYMAISDSGKLDVLWSIGKASSKNFRVSEPSVANTASGKIMMLGFGGDGNVNNLKIWGNARSTYFVDDNNGMGCNEVNGDSVAVLFSQGKARFVTLAGSTRGMYFSIQ
jgi:lipopolysaccharide assembly outer membrane protein LptD (OstA)